MSYYSLALCAVILSNLLPVAAFRESELQCDRTISLFQADFRIAKTKATPSLPEPNIFMMETTERADLFLRVPHAHIAVNLTYNTLGEEITTFPLRRPRHFNVILATCKTWSADAIVQFGERRRGHTWVFDWSRSLSFAMFGFLYIGLVQWFLYVSILTAIFPDAATFANAQWEVKLQDQVGLWDIAGQVFVDNLIFQAMIYFPVFYTVKMLLQGGLVNVFSEFPSRLMTGLSKYRENVWADNLASIAIWVPADVVIFACPMYLRMPLEHCVSFGWTMFISSTRGGGEKVDTKPEP